MIDNYYQRSNINTRNVIVKTPSNMHGYAILIHYQRSNINTLYVQLYYYSPS